jgi:N6-adenosine-specific RNA methylase IME4
MPTGDTVIYSQTSIDRYKQYNDSRGTGEMMQLVKYEAARKALAEANRVDEARDIDNVATALEAYARQTKNADMESWVTEIKLRAKRRIGELTREIDKSHGNRYTVESPVGGLSKKEVLKQAGVTKQEANRCEQIAGIPEQEFNEYLHTKREKNAPVTVNEVLRNVQQPKKRKKKILYNLIYADPPWRYEYSKSTSRDIENQYPTMSLDDIKNLDVPAHDDSILFLWATSPKLNESLEVLQAWGFDYKTCAVWDKQKIGMGYYFRQQHEILLIGSKGDIPTPEPANRPASIFSYPRNKHSEKPIEVYDIITSMYPEFASEDHRIELFSRNKMSKWAAWGNQVDI